MNINNVPQSSPDLFTKVGIAATVFSGIALIASYLNHILFYSFFGIPISNYIQVGEAVVLFIPQLISYVYSICISFVLYVLIGKLFTLALLRDSRISFNTSIYNIGSITNSDLPIFIAYKEVVNFITDVKNGKTKLDSAGLFSLLSAFYGFFLFLTIGFCSIYIGPKIVASAYGDSEIIHKTKQEVPIVVMSFLLTLFSFNQIFGYILTIFSKDLPIKAGEIIVYLKMIFTLLLFIYIKSMIDAENIKSGFSEVNISFLYNGKSLVRTGNDLIYIGGTQNFVFLRDSKSRKNRIYKMSNIDYYELKEVNYYYVWFWQQSFYK